MRLMIVIPQKRLPVLLLLMYSFSSKSRYHFIVYYTYLICILNIFNLLINFISIISQKKYYLFFEYYSKNPMIIRIKIFSLLLGIK